MLNSIPSRLRGSGSKPGPRGRGSSWLVLIALPLLLSGCATKRDLRDLQDTIAALAAQQESTFGEIEGLNMAVQDTLRGQSDALFESRGEILRRIFLL